MDKAIQQFPQQFTYQPVVENGGTLVRKEKLIVAGMGGSHLAADIIKTINPAREIIIHKNYGLPALPDKSLREYLFAASSYSGNTEEAVDALEHAIAKHLSVIIISTNGKLLDIAKERALPYIKLPDTDIQPRAALGFSFRALLKVLGDDEELQESEKLANTLKPETFEARGKMLAELLKNRVPVIYASERNEALAYNWKIKFNETGKIPAFYNVFPELNHNEMTGFDVNNETKKFAGHFSFIFLKDASDHPRIKKRMDVLEKQYNDRGFGVEAIELAGENIYQKIFANLLIADWAALHAARQYGQEPEEVPMIEEFKKKI